MFLEVFSAPPAQGRPDRFVRRDPPGSVPVPVPLLFVVVVAELSCEATVVGRGKKQKCCFSDRRGR